MTKSCLLGSLVSIAAAACGAGEGTVVVTAYGESFIEEGISADDMSDGWAVTFERFEVSLSDVQVAGVQIEVPAMIDLARSSDGAGHELGAATAGEGSHRDASFRIDRVAVDGSAVLGAEEKTWSWVFDQATAYEACETSTTIPDGGTATFQITLHADHLFYDSLVSATPQVVFQPMADADANDDGDITQAELAMTTIGSFDPGSEGDIDDLWGWLVAATRTLGHVDGEGHCEAAPVSGG
jgi:hypothetical protein